LIVDDAALVRSRLVALLDEVPGVETREADTLEAALDHATSADVVVLDIHLPMGSGLDVVPVLHAMRPRPLIIVLTNDATEQHRHEALTLGADHFLDKSREFTRVAELVAAAHP
jgi:DNA-binding NarL/FixJ family response regulator